MFSFDGYSSASPAVCPLRLSPSQFCAAQGSIVTDVHSCRMGSLPKQFHQMERAEVPLLIGNWPHDVSCGAAEGRPSWAHTTLATRGVQPWRAQSVLQRPCQKNSTVPWLGLGPLASLTEPAEAHKGAVSAGSLGHLGWQPGSLSHGNQQWRGWSMQGTQLT